MGASFMGLALLLILSHQTLSAPVAEEGTEITDLESYPAEGCYYNFEHYEEGDRIVTNEPCLNCTCHNHMLMCYLRVCPFTKAIGQDCTVEKKPDQCCPVITCPEVPVQLLTSSTTEKPTTLSTAVGRPDNYGCTLSDNTFYPDGAQLPSDPRKPCEICYCIRNRTACIMQECTLQVEGCQPVYQQGVCCPVRYDCDYDSVTTPGTTLGLITTPGGSSQCLHDSVVYNDGEMVEFKGKSPCEHCYCMRGDVVCAVQECGAPLQAPDCVPLPPPPGHCCPDTFQCANGTVPLESLLGKPESQDDSHSSEVHSQEEIHSDSAHDNAAEGSESSEEQKKPQKTGSESENSESSQEGEDSSTEESKPSGTSDEKATDKPLQGTPSYDVEENKVSNDNLETPQEITEPHHKEQDSTPDVHEDISDDEHNIIYGESDSKPVGELSPESLTHEKPDKVDANLNSEAPSLADDNQSGLDKTEVEAPESVHEAANKEEEDKPYNTIMEDETLHDVINKVEDNTDDLNNLEKENADNVTNKEEESYNGVTNNEEATSHDLTNQEEQSSHDVSNIQDENVHIPTITVTNNEGEPSHDLTNQEEQSSHDVSNIQDENVQVPTEDTFTAVTNNEGEPSHDLTNQEEQTSHDVSHVQDENPQVSTEGSLNAELPHHISEIPLGGDSPSSMTTPENKLEDHESGHISEGINEHFGDHQENIESSQSTEDNPSLPVSSDDLASISESDETMVTGDDADNQKHTTTYHDDKQGQNEGELTNTESSHPYYSIHSTESEVSHESSSEKPSSDPISESEEPEKDSFEITHGATLAPEIESEKDRLHGVTPESYTEVSVETVEIHTSTPEINHPFSGPTSQASLTDVPSHTTGAPSNVEGDVSQSETGQKTHDDSEVTTSIASGGHDITTILDSGNVPRLPGEGNCIIDGHAYPHDSEVHTSNACQVSCKCLNSIVHCKLVECPPAPTHYANCMPLQEPDTCCPSYTCDDKPSLPLESHSQVSTEYPEGAEDSSQHEESEDSSNTPYHEKPSHDQAHFHPEVEETSEEIVKKPSTVTEEIDSHDSTEETNNLLTEDEINKDHQTNLHGHDEPQTNKESSENIEPQTVSNVQESTHDSTTDQVAQNHAHDTPANELFEESQGGALEVHDQNEKGEEEKVHAEEESTPPLNNLKPVNSNEDQHIGIMSIDQDETGPTSQVDEQKPDLPIDHAEEPISHLPETDGEMSHPDFIEESKDKIHEEEQPTENINSPENFSPHKDEVSEQPHINGESNDFTTVHNVADEISSHKESPDQTVMNQISNNEVIYQSHPQNNFETGDTPETATHDEHPEKGDSEYDLGNPSEQSPHEGNTESILLSSTSKPTVYDDINETHDSATSEIPESDTSPHNGSETHNEGVSEMEKESTQPTATQSETELTDNQTNEITHDQDTGVAQEDHTNQEHLPVDHKPENTINESYDNSGISANSNNEGESSLEQNLHSQESEQLEDHSLEQHLTETPSNSPDDHEANNEVGSDVPVQADLNESNEQQTSEQEALAETQSSLEDGHPETNEAFEDKLEDGHAEKPHTESEPSENVSDSSSTSSHDDKPVVNNQSEEENVVYTSPTDDDTSSKPDKPSLEEDNSADEQPHDNTISIQDGIGGIVHHETANEIEPIFVGEQPVLPNVQESESDKPQNIFPDHEKEHSNENEKVTQDENSSKFEEEATSKEPEDHSAHSESTQKLPTDDENIVQGVAASSGEEVPNKEPTDNEVLEPHPVQEDELTQPNETPEENISNEVVGESNESPLSPESEAANVVGSNEGESNEHTPTSTEDNNISSPDQVLDHHQTEHEEIESEISIEELHQPEQVNHDKEPGSSLFEEQQPEISTSSEEHLVEHHPDSSEGSHKPDSTVIEENMHETPLITDTDVTEQQIPSEGAEHPDVPVSYGDHASGEAHGVDSISDGHYTPSSEESSQEPINPMDLEEGKPETPESVDKTSTNAQGEVSLEAEIPESEADKTYETPAETYETDVPTGSHVHKDNPAKIHDTPAETQESEESTESDLQEHVPENIHDKPNETQVSEEHSDLNEHNPQKINDVPTDNIETEEPSESALNEIDPEKTLVTPTKAQEGEVSSESDLYAHKPENMHGTPTETQGNEVSSESDLHEHDPEKMHGILTDTSEAEVSSESVLNEYDLEKTQETPTQAQESEVPSESDLHEHEPEKIHDSPAETQESEESTESDHHDQDPEKTEGTPADTHESVEPTDHEPEKVHDITAETHESGEPTEHEPEKVHATPADTHENVEPTEHEPEKVHDITAETHESGEPTEYEPEKAHDTPAETHESGEPTEHKPENAHDTLSETHESGEPTEYEPENAHDTANETHGSVEPTEYEPEKAHETPAETHESGEPTEQEPEKAHDTAAETNESGEPTEHEPEKAHDTAAETHGSGEPTEHEPEKAHDTAAETHGSGEPTEHEPEKDHDTAAETHGSGEPSEYEPEKVHDAAAETHVSGEPTEYEPEKVHDTAAETHESVEPSEHETEKVHDTAAETNESIEPTDYEPEKVHDTAAETLGSGEPTEHEPEKVHDTAAETAAAAEDVSNQEIPMTVGKPQTETSYTDSHQESGGDMFPNSDIDPSIPGQVENNEGTTHHDSIHVEPENVLHHDIDVKPDLTVADHHIDDTEYHNKPTDESAVQYGGNQEEGSNSAPGHETPNISVQESYAGEEGVDNILPEIDSHDLVSPSEHGTAPDNFNAGPDGSNAEKEHKTTMGENEGDNKPENGFFESAPSSEASLPSSGSTYPELQPSSQNQQAAEQATTLHPSENLPGQPILTESPGHHEISHDSQQSEKDETSGEGVPIEGSSYEDNTQGSEMTFPSEEHGAPAAGFSDSDAVVNAVYAVVHQQEGANGLGDSKKPSLDQHVDTQSNILGHDTVSVTQEGNEMPNLDSNSYPEEHHDNLHHPQQHLPLDSDNGHAEGSSVESKPEYPETSSQEDASVTQGLPESSIPEQERPSLVNIPPIHEHYPEEETGTMDTTHPDGAHDFSYGGALPAVDSGSTIVPEVPIHHSPEYLPESAQYPHGGHSTSGHTETSTENVFTTAIPEAFVPTNVINPDQHQVQENEFFQPGGPLFQNWSQKPLDQGTTTKQPPTVPHIPEDSQYPYEPESDYEEEDSNYSPGTCRYGGKIYLSAQQIPRDDPCDFCFCFRSDIICLQQSCPPPIQHCYQENIPGFCCPRYECHVSMATMVNVSTTTTTTTTTLPPHFLAHAYKGAAKKTGCQVKGVAYRVGERIPSTSGPCLDCRCGADGQMKCEPTVCNPQETLLRQVMDAAVISRRRRHIMTTPYFTARRLR